MESTTKSSTPRKSRFTLQGEQKATLVFSGSVETPSECEAHLIDFSENGARLRVDHEIPFQEAVGLTLALPALGVSFRLACKVCWTARSKDGSWQFGCSIQPGIPDRVFSRLAEGAVIDRHALQAAGQELRIDAFWDDGRPERSVFLHDCSSGGFCVLSPTSAEVGKTLRLRLKRPDGLISLVGGRTEWTLEAGGEYVVGCSFPRDREFKRLLACVAG